MFHVIDVCSVACNSSLRDGLVLLLKRQRLLLFCALAGVVERQALFVEVHRAEQVVSEVFQVLVLDDLRSRVRHEGSLPAVKERLPLRQDALAVVLALGEQRFDERLAVVRVVLRREFVQPSAS